MHGNFWFNMTQTNLPMCYSLCVSASVSVYGVCAIYKFPSHLPLLDLNFHYMCLFQSFIFFPFLQANSQWNISIHFSPNSLADCIFLLPFAHSGCCDVQIWLRFFITVTFYAVCQSVFSRSAWVFGMCTTASMTTATAVENTIKEDWRGEKK